MPLAQLCFSCPQKTQQRQALRSTPRTQTLGPPASQGFALKPEGRLALSQLTARGETQGRRCAQDEVGRARGLDEPSCSAVCSLPWAAAGTSHSTALHRRRRGLGHDCKLNPAGRRPRAALGTCVRVAD